MSNQVEIQNLRLKQCDSNLSQMDRAPLRHIMAEQRRLKESLHQTQMHVVRIYYYTNYDVHVHGKSGREVRPSYMATGIIIGTRYMDVIIMYIRLCVPWNLMNNT